MMLWSKLCLIVVLFMMTHFKVVFAQDTQTLLVWGDSLSAAYGLNSEQGWVSLLQKRLADNPQSAHIKIVNGSISGETTSGGLTRLSAALQQYKPHYVILELGANDGLRGLSIKAMRSNLEQMIQQSQAMNAKVMLLGMYVPANLGRSYSEQFSTTFKDLAKHYQLVFHPFFLEGVALKDELLLPDGLHPNAKAQPIILNTLWPDINRLIAH